MFNGFFNFDNVANHLKVDPPVYNITQPAQKEPNYGALRNASSSAPISNSMMLKKLGITDKEYKYVINRRTMNITQKIQAELDDTTSFMNLMRLCHGYYQMNKTFDAGKDISVNNWREDVIDKLDTLVEESPTFKRDFLKIVYSLYMYYSAYINGTTTISSDKAPEDIDEKIAGKLLEILKPKSIIKSFDFSQIKEPMIGGWKLNKSESSAQEHYYGTPFLKPTVTENITPNFIKKLKSNEIFVFNTDSTLQHNSKSGQSAIRFGAKVDRYGFMGTTFGIITKDNGKVASLESIRTQIENLHKIALSKPHINFYVPNIASLKDKSIFGEIASYFKEFKDMPNVYLTKQIRAFL